MRDAAELGRDHLDLGANLRVYPVRFPITEHLEAARAAEKEVRISYQPEPHDVRLRPDHPGLYAPDKVNPNFPTDTEKGDVTAGLAAAAVSVDATYTTPAMHNNPMEPHAAMAVWDPDGALTVYDSTQGPSADRDTIAAALGLPPGKRAGDLPARRRWFRIQGHHPAARDPGRTGGAGGRPPVKVALTRQQMFDVTGYRTPTIQRLRLGADGEGRLTALVHDVAEQSSTLVEFAEQTATPSRVMYAAPALRTTHRLVRLDVPTPSWMRAPGECPGMFALESAMDELAVAAGLDPVELRVRERAGRRAGERPAVQLPEPGRLPA